MNLGKDIIENGTVLIPVLWIPSIMANDTAGHGWWTRCRGENPAIESSVLCGSFRRNDHWYPIAEKTHQAYSVLANERTQIRSDPVPGLSVDTLGAFRVEIAVTRSESDLDRSG